MSRIAPFRGLRFNPDRAGSMADLVGPPHDPVNRADRDNLRDRSEFNILRLLYSGECAPGELSRGSQVLADWTERGAIIRDERPAIYLYEIDYRIEPSAPPATRTGFISLARLIDYQLGMVRPHEQTFSAIKADRLDSLTDCQANLSQVLTFYDDPEETVLGLLRAAAPAEPVYDFTDRHEVTHRLWPVTDPAAHLAAARFLETRHLYIADGHHRYETCLAHRQEMRRLHPQADGRAPFNYTLIYAAPMQDPGLAILPAHRLLNRLDGFDEPAFLDRVGAYFDLETTGLRPGSAEDRAKFAQVLKAEAGQGKTIGYAAPESESLRLLRLKPEVLYSLQAHPALKDLDVIALREVVFRRVLGLSKAARADDKLFTYDPNLDSALARVGQGKVRAGFFLNPTRVSQVKGVADAGLVMPRKSTTFFPKVTAGLVMSPQYPDELAIDPLYRP